MASAHLPNTLSDTTNPGSPGLTLFTPSASTNQPFPATATTNDYPVRRTSVPAAVPPYEPTSAPIAEPFLERTMMNPAQSLQLRGSQDITLLLNTVTFSGSICMFTAATALTCTAPPSCVLDACAVIGVIGTLFAGSAVSLAVNRAPAFATRMQVLSGICAATGAICLVAGTKSWKTTVVAMACLAGMLVPIARFALWAERIGDTEKELPRFVNEEERAE